MIFVSCFLPSSDVCWVVLKCKKKMVVYFLTYLEKGEKFEFEIEFGIEFDLELNLGLSFILFKGVQAFILESNDTFFIKVDPIH